MADTTGRDGFFDEPDSEEADDFFSGGSRDAAPARRGESLDEILRDGSANDRRDESISNIHTGSKEEHVSVVMSPPPEGAPPPPTPVIEPDQYTPGDPPPPIDPIDVDQEAGGTYQTEERGLDFGFDEGQFREDRVFDDVRRPDEEEEVRREGERADDDTEELILTPQTKKEDDDPTVPTEVDDNPEAPVVANSVLDEDDLSGGSDGAGPRSITKPLIIDFGDDGAGSVQLTIPESLKQVQAGPDGSTLNVALSPDGKSITAVTTDGEPVFKVTLNTSGGNYSYTFELQGPVHHGEADQIDFPIGVAVTDSDGDLAVGEFKVGIVDDEPVARDDDTVSVDEGAGNTIGSENGADNLLANDEVGADGALIFQFTYTDENGEEQTARAGETVDTEHGTLTVNADGSWSFEADEQIEHDGNEVVADNFTYSIVDADGDTSSATQSIEITDDGPKIGFPPDDDDPDGKGDLATLFEDDIAGGNASVTQTLDIEFGTDGEGSVALSIPQELEDMGLTADGKPVEFSLSDDGQSIVATAGGEPVFTMSLSEEGGEYSYTFELQGNLDHPDAGSDVLSNLPFDLTVTDGDGSTASAEININVVDDQPEAVGETTLKMEEGGGTVGSGNGGQNLLANDDLGADGGEITSFTYVDEDGNQQTAQAGETVDTEHGTLTVNSDGSWSFTADDSADHSDGKVQDGFTYTVTDGDGDTSQATQRIEITDTGPEIPPNDPPTGNPPGAGDQPDLGRADLIVDEDNMGAATQAIEVDFGSDGFGSASLSVPQELQDMNLTSGGEVISYTVSDDGQSITASTPDGEAVFTVTLNANPETGEMSYTVELQGNVDHAESGAGDDLMSNIPVTLTVTDGDGTEASTNLEIGIKDDNPEAANDAAVTLEEGVNTVGSDNGGDNLLANDDVGADGGHITSFTYTDEDGNQQTAEAGQTVDTEHGTLTVNSDGSWSFESDPNADHSDGSVTDGFTYTITDGDGDTATASQSITVTDTGPEIPPNDPPTGNPPGAGDQPDLGRADLIVDEDNMGAATQAIEVDFGSDGFGSASLSVPQELQDMNLTSGGEAINYTVSEDGQSITASTPDGEAVFTVTLNANPETGEMSYTVDLQGNVDHAESGAGDDLMSNIPVTLTVTDGDGTEASTNLEIGIKDDNPVAQDDAAVTLEEGVNTVGSDNGGDNLLANDDVGADGGHITSFTYTDEDGNQQTAEAGQTVDTEHGTLTVNSDGSWSFESDPNADHSDGSVTDGFTYTITDGDGDTATASQSITVTDTGPEIPPNDPPTGNPPGAGDQPDLGRADLIVDEDNMGAATQAIEVDFGSDGFGSASLSVPQELQDMNLTSGGEAINYTVSEDGQSITASTPDGEAVFTVTLNANPETGEMSYTVDLQGNVDHAESGAGDDLMSNIPVTLTVTDGDGTEASTNLEIGIKDDNPEAQDDAAVSLGEDGESLNVSAQDGLLSNDDLGADGGQITSFTYTDEDGNQQTAEAGQTVDTEHGQLTVNSDGSWSFTSDENIDHGESNVVTDGFTYTITDGDGDTATATQEINITDEGPRIVPPSGEPGADGYSVTLDEDNLGDGTATAGGQALNIDFGADGEGSVALSVPQELQDMNLTAGGEPVTFTVSEDGQSITGATPDGSPVMTITLNEDSGNYSYSVELSDNLDHTGANGETISDIPVTLTVTDGDGDTATTSLHVNVIDDAPEAANDAAVTLEEGGNTVGSGNGGDNLLANDDVGADGGHITSFTYTDEDGNQQTAEAGQTVDTEHGTLTVNSDGSWSFESDPNADHSDGSVTDGFTYTITDGDGDTATASQSITVTDTGPEIPPNDPPTGNPPGAGDQPDLGRADLIVDEDNMGAATQAIEVDFGSDGFGSASLSVPQELQDMNLTSGGEVISYTVSDDGQSITASTPDGEAVFTVTLNANPETGEMSYTVELQGNVDHAESGAGDDLMSNIPVTLTVTDGDGTEASTNLEIGIKDDNPEAANDAAVTLEEGVNTVGSGNGGDNLLANDDVGADGGHITSFTYTDEDGNQQTAEAGQTVDTEHGTLTVNSDGSWSFESDPNADHSDGSVTDGFTYTITDGDGDTATASQSITVTDTGPEIPPNDPPTGNPPGAGDQPDLGRADLIVDEDNMGAATQAIEVDFGSDGFGSASLSVPQELQDMNLTSGGEAINYTVSEDGQSITASTPDGEAVFTVTLNANPETGEMSYTVDLQGNVDHAESGAGDDLMSNIPVTLTVTDGDGTEASTNLEIGIKDDNPVAQDDAAVTLDEGGDSLSVSAENGLLSNDDLGADGGQITSFTYTDENGNEQTAEAGSTVDTENGQLTVNADGSWSFTSDDNADHSAGDTVSDGFTYTITDGDGDTATATQTIEITDDGPKIGPPPGTGGGEPGADGYSVTLDEGNLGDGTATAGGQALNIDFGADGEGSVALSVPQELQDMNLTAGGEPVTFTVSEDGQSITGATPDGSPVMTITLNEDSGNYSYSVELSDNLDHTGANGETISDIPVTLTVTDGDGDSASTSLNVNVIDDAPVAVDDGTFNVTDGGAVIGTDGGADNLLANDDLGADGAQVTSFTYIDEGGNQQTAEAGSTVDTEQGTLTVNADGTWSFESGDKIESADGSPVMDNFTYTITDGDGDTSTANVTINVSDGTSEPPELVVGDAIGYEDNAIPLNISTSLTDTDGSESLSITISGVPEGATLSAGTDNGDGTWTLEEGDLDGLTVTPPTDSDIDFDLSVSVTSTEASTGETTTVTDTFTVEVDAVADPTTVSATVEAKLVGGEPVTETVSGEGSIDASNFNQPGQGFTVSARTLNADGSLSDASADNVTSQSGGLGVKGSASDGEPDAQLGFNPETETSEQLVIDFDHDVTELSFTVSRLFADEGDGKGDAAGNEQGRWQVFDDGELVAEGTFDNESGNEGTFSIDLPDGVSFNQIVFSATEYSGGDGDQTQDSSDYFIKDIDFSYQDTIVVEESEPQCEITVNVDATFGDFTDGSENHFIVVEVPEGWEPQGEYVEVDSSNYGEGHFIAIPVDAEDLQASGGSISVPVQFLAPAPDADESVDLDVFAVAQEVNIDGTVGNGEITLDNNNTMSKATVTVEHKDVVVEDPTLEAEDAQGYEDNAIALGIDAGLTDTDGSESLSITISGVPEGATLSAGTDNGDGTWTLEEGDLDGLTITPPADSDADFELSVSATSTESSTGESKTINTTIDVKVDAVADDTTVSGGAETDGIGGGDHAVTVNLNATFGDYEDGSESHFVLVEVPDGWEAPEGSTVVDGGDFDSLPDKQFVKIEVDNADLADNGGSAHVSVTFQVPDDQASGDINFDVFSGAAENPGDGEITLDNNTSFSGTQVTASYEDGAPTVEAGEVRLDENNLGDGSTSATGDINIDFGADGEGTVIIGVPAELEDMGLTSGGEPITFTVSEDGQSITGSTPDGSPVLTITLNEDGGDYSYTVEMQAPLDHGGESGDLIDDMPVTLTVTDGNGESTETTLNIDIADAVPQAVDDGTFNVADGGATIGTDGGAVNLLANDDLGADGAEVTSFTYTDENGETQTAQAGETVDTEQGTLTVNADGTWSFESDEQMESADGQPVMDNFTYTIRDGDGDTSTANVTINVTDGTAQEPELVVGDAIGYEDNAIPLNIDASLTDTDGSESLSITISGMPDGAVLSAGTDNGDGSWTLEEGDLDGLTVTPPADSDIDFDLSVSVTSTEASTGDTSTVETTFTVEVDAVADPTTVSATVETTIVEGDPAPETGDITVTNSGHEEAGFHNTYGYYIKDEDGNPTEGKIIFADTKDNIGDSYTIEDVDPDRVGFFVLPNGDNVNQGLSNGMDVTFEQDESGNWHVVNAETGETLVGDGSYQQAGNQDSLFFSDNNLNADGMDHVEDTSTVGNQNWEDLMKTATGQDNDYDDVNMQVDFKPDSGEATEPHCEITVNVDATFGDYSDGSENHFVVVQVPDGWEPQGEFVQVDSSNYGEGNFIAIPVDAEDLQASGGSISVPVTFVAPVPEDDGSVSVNVFAVAQEVNIDGTVGDGEITLDNNNTMSQATVEVENKDMQVEEPTLEVTDAEGYEDNAIALNINAALGDTDGSETMSVTISGVPAGATLSAGTDNGDGTWTLEEGDLDGLTVTPPVDSDVDFDLTVSVTSTESSTGETSTVEQTFTVEVDAVADDVGVSAEIKTTVVPGEGSDAEPETVTIGADNYDEGDSGFTVSGRTLDSDGNLSEGSTDNISVKSSGYPTGFGVKGDASNGAASEIGYEDGKSEQVVIDFDSDVSQANVTIAWQNPNEDCRITLYRDGEPVGEVVIEGGTDGVDSLGVFKADDGGSFDQMVFEATGENSDFLVHEVSFEVAPPEPEPVCEVEIDVTASFGDYEDGSEQHFVFVEVPEGMTPTDENAQTVEGNAENGLPEGQTFVVVEVDAADIEAGGGTVTVPVSFTGPVPEGGAPISANVYAGAVETNLDGGEITFDNNMKLAGTSVEATPGDTTVSDPDMDMEDAAGLEDTAIPLDLNISLTDTDGSESMSITISDVPEGATLSAGTDNGDGTWTLEEGDLDGLTITPPHDSDVDFDLKVEVSVTESATGETKTFSEDVKVTVEADADAPTLDASLSVSDSGDDGTDGGGKGQHDNRGHGNNVDGVDDDNPGKGGGGPQAHKEGDNFDEDEGTRGGDGGAGAWRGAGLDNDFVDDGNQNHQGTGDDDTFVVDRDLNMNENFNMGDGDDTVIVNGDTSQGHNFNMGAGDDNLALNGDINGNTAMDGGDGNDVLYLEGDSDQYTLQNFTNNQGHINTQIIDNSTGQTITVNNVEAISFGDGEVVGNADLVDRDAGGGDTGGEPSATVYDLDIDSALSDIDGSESLTITLGPVPDGVSFSAGTDNGDGTWSLEPEDLQDLQMTVEAEVNADFDLPIKATSTEAENGDSESVNMSLKVELPEDHGDPVDPPVNNDGTSGHGSGQGTGGGKSASGHGTGGASKVAKSGSGHGKGKSGSGQGKSGSGHGRGGASKVGKSGSGHGKGGHSKQGRGGSGSGHGRGGHSKVAGSGSGHGKGGHSKQGRGGSGSGHGRGGHSAKGGHSRGGSGHGRGGHSGQGNSGHGRGFGGSGHGHGSGQGIAAAAGGSGHGGPQGNNGFGNGDQDAPGGSADHNNAENAGGGDGDRLMAALEKFSNASPPTEDGGGDTFRNVGAGRGGGDDGGNWFDEQQEAPQDDDVFGKTEMEQKEEDDQKAEEAQREDEENGIQIPAEDNGAPEADFEDRSLV